MKLCWRSEFVLFIVGKPDKDLIAACDASCGADLGDDAAVTPYDLCYVS
jgi:hypothetical protein